MARVGALLSGLAFLAWLGLSVASWWSPGMWTFVAWLVLTLLAVAAITVIWLVVVPAGAGLRAGREVFRGP